MLHFDVEDLEGFVTVGFHVDGTIFEFDLAGDNKHAFSFAFLVKLNLNVAKGILFAAGTLPCLEKCDGTILR